ncbi:MAG: GNAT family N-acetyltransferase [Ilumatobacteraceae bacterium]
MNGSEVRTQDGAARAWRVRQWPNDPTIAHLIFTDHLVIPTPASIDAAVEHARRRGAHAVRTSALFPRAADVVLDAGFTRIDQLALLRFSLSDAADGLPDLRLRLQPLRRRHFDDAACVDQGAFGLVWGNDARTLRDIRRATPHHRARGSWERHTLRGFALTGAAGDNGYLQRLAVDPEARRQGRAHDLVVDSLQWMHRRGLQNALVNTGVTNEAALALYRSIGFRPLDDSLIIAELRLTG